MDGTKILSMRVEHFVFVDSLNYLNMPLKSMPKAFDLSCKKGFYPHFFNTHQNLDYVGPYPDVEYYGADYMSEGDRAQFLEWHNEQKDKIFNNRDQLLAHCMDDVTVLRQACCIFRNLFLYLVKMDHFREAITISSICSKVFRYKFLKPNTVGLIPRAGYRMGDRQSVEALKWLAHISPNKIIHVGNGREVHLQGLRGIKDDGYLRRPRSLNT
jgi:hypothetical protein